MGEAQSFSSNGSVWWTANWENAKEEEYIDTLSEQLKTLVNWISILNSANAVFEGIQDVTKGDMHCGFIDTPNSPRILYCGQWRFAQLHIDSLTHIQAYTETDSGIFIS